MKKKTPGTNYPPLFPLAHNVCESVTFQISLISCVVFNREKKIIIDWSSKSACTIIVKMFFDMNNQTIDPNVWIHDERERYIREKGYIRLSNLLDPRPLKIKFVRTFIYIYIYM